MSEYVAKETPGMTPQQALRTLELLIDSSDLPHDPHRQARECLDVLWGVVLG